MQDTNKNMYRQYKKLIERQLSVHDQNQIIGTVMARIEKARHREMQSRALIYGVFVIGAIALFKPAWDLFMSDAGKSGFFQYVSLITSGGMIVLQTWKDLALSLTESFPVVEISLLVGIVLLFAYSARKISPLLANLFARETGHDNAVRQYGLFV